MASERCAFFARTCISPYEILTILPSVETQLKPQKAGSNYKNSKYEFLYSCKRYRANIKDIEANEAKINRSKYNGKTLYRQERLELRKQILACQYLHRQNETLLNRILRMLHTQRYVVEHPAFATTMIRFYEKFRNDAVKGIRKSQLLLLELFPHGAVCNASDTCQLNEERIMANIHTISQFEMEAMRVKEFLSPSSSNSNLTKLAVEQLKNITMLGKGLLEENWTLLNENKNLYQQSSNVRLMAGSLGDCINLSKRIGECLSSLEANKQEFLLLLRCSNNSFATNQNLALNEKELIEEEKRVAEIHALQEICSIGSLKVIPGAAQQISYPNRRLPNSSQNFHPFPAATSTSCNQSGIRFQTRSESQNENDDSGKGPGCVETDGSNNLLYDDIGMYLDQHQDFGFENNAHSSDADSFMNTILNQILQRDYEDLVVH